jgi:hypothetical protein
LARAKTLAAEAGRSSPDAGEKFRLLADAYAAVSAHPSDAACAAFAEELSPEVRSAARRANAAADVSPNKTLVEH